MYSPKIKPELIPKLYIIAKECKKPMTKLVSGILEEYLNNGRQSGDMEPPSSSSLVQRLEDGMEHNDWERA